MSKKQLTPSDLAEELKHRIASPFIYQRTAAAMAQLANEATSPKPERGNWMECEDGCNNFRYSFSYNEEADAIEIGFIFMNGVREPDVVSFHPFATIRQFSKGFTDSDHAKQITRKAFEFFTANLGQSISAAIQFTAFMGLLHGGYEFPEGMNTPTKLKKKLATEQARLVSKSLKVTRGPRGGSKQSRVRVSKRDLRAEIAAAIRELDALDERPTRPAVAGIIGARVPGLNNAKALDRARTNHGDTRPWATVQEDALKKKGR
jgi:hypothetical protein